MVNVAQVEIAGTPVGPGAPTFVIAEIGINHEGNLEAAKRLVAAAAESGASAAKLQTYRTETRVPADSPAFDLLKQAELDAAAHEELARVASDHGILLISTAFDDAAIELLSTLGVPAYKVASFDIVNLALIQLIAEQGRPVIVSRGMATVEESDQAVELVRDAGAEPILLHCVSAYPLNPADANLAIIDTLCERYRCPVGFSDHTLGIDVALYAVARGADAIEKHFTLDKNAEGPDHAMSAEPAELAELCRRIREVETVLGSPEPRLLDAEGGTLPFRRPSEPLS